MAIKFNELKKSSPIDMLPAGAQELTIEKIEVVLNESGEFRGLQVSPKGYLKVYHPVFEGDDETIDSFLAANPSLNNLVHQLGRKKLDPQLDQPTKMWINVKYSNGYCNLNFLPPVQVEKEDTSNYAK